MTGQILAEKLQNKSRWNCAFLQKVQRHRVLPTIEFLGKIFSSSQVALLGVLRTGPDSTIETT